jgi:SprB repeat
MKMQFSHKITILLVFLFPAVTGISQTITIGSGTAINNYNEASPVNITRDRSVSWTVYTVAELNAAGISGASTINRMGFFVTNIPVNTIPGYTIQMKHTNVANAGSNPGNNGYAVVKNAFTYSPTQGDWDMLDLDTPFNWNGTQNIAVKICWSTANNDPSGQLRVYPATNGYRYRWTNNGNGSYCGANPNTNRQWKPQVRFVFELETFWTGAVSSDWFNTANWSAGIPDATMDTRIPSGTPNNPVLTGLAEVANLTLQGVMTMGAAGTLNVYRDFINSGNYIDNGGSTVLTGEGPNIINNSSTLEISNLIVESKFGGTVSGSNITITEELQVNKSALNTNDSITLKSDASGTARISELTTNCFYQLDMFDQWGDGWNGGFLTILEDGVPVFTYQAYGSSTTEIMPIANGSLLQLQYSSGNWENENSYTLFDPTGTPIFSDGPNPSTGIVFTTTASCGFTNPISGEISMERYIDAGETYWRYFGSAVQGATLAQFNDDFTTAGYPGSLYPNFGWVSAYNYNETLGAGLGYQIATGATQVMGVGEGWQIWCGDTITGTQPFTFDLRGVPNQGDINLPVTYNNFGLPADDGFNLICNPYASTIDWDDADWTKANMANAVYIQNPDNQQYATYVAGASTNGGSRFIASQQSFWVQAFAASPILTAREGVKSTTDQAFIKSGSIASPGMTISLLGNQEFDEAVLRHIDGSSSGFDYEWDADKYWGGWGLYPQVSLLNTDDDDQTVHSFDKSFQEWQIPMRAVVFQTGTYAIKFEQVSEMEVPCMLLEDTYDGMMYPISEGAIFYFELSDTTWAPRFVIHVGRNYAISSTDASCFGDTDGTVQIDLDDTNPYDYELILNGNSTYGNDFVNPLRISGLVSGAYNLEIPTFANLCGVTTFNFVVNEPNPINSNAILSPETNGSDGSIALNLTGGMAPYVFDWDTGEITSAIYDLTGGTYSVQITDANDCIYDEDFVVESILGLEAESSETIEENAISFIYNLTDNTILVSGLLDATEKQLSLYTVNGQLIRVYPLNIASNSQSIILPHNLSEGVYILSGSSINFKFKY